MNKKNSFKDSKNSHLTYKDRCIIHEFLNYGYSFTAIGNRLHKDRTTISKEIKKHRFLKPYGKQKEITCTKLDKPPYVCIGCSNLGKCYKAKHMYDAAINKFTLRHIGLFQNIRNCLLKMLIHTLFLYL